MTQPISQNRYLFTQSLAFIPKSKYKWVYIAKEAVKIIPLLSIFPQALELNSTLKKRHFYRKTSGCMWDVRFSYLSIAKQSINLLGLGVLILPFRIAATHMHNKDVKHKRLCDNPHRLGYWHLRDCKMINECQQEHYEGILRNCPRATDYAKRMAFRDHVQYPEYLHTSAYKDPFEIPSDAPIKADIKEAMKKYQYENHMKARNYIRGRRND